MRKLVLDNQTINGRDVQLRPCEPADLAFLYQVFCSTRPDVIHAPLPAPQIEQLLQTQFRAQHIDYHSNYANARYSVVQLNGVPIGRIYIDRREDEIRLLDIALLPEYRGLGIGTQLVGGVIEEGRVCKKPVRIHVELGSREVRFYERLGFEKIGELPTHQLMECH